MSVSGNPFYDELPDGFCVAKIEDFFTILGDPILGMPFLVKSMITDNCYWANRVKPGFPYVGSDFLKFCDADQVYINAIFA